MIVPYYRLIRPDSAFDFVGLGTAHYKRGKAVYLAEVLAPNKLIKDRVRLQPAWEQCKHIKQGRMDLDKMRCFDLTTFTSTIAPGIAYKG